MTRRKPAPPHSDSSIPHPAMLDGYREEVFSPGSYYGLRQFVVGTDATLHGKHLGLWEPGENVATCPHHTDPPQNYWSSSAGVQYPCGCGLWAYWPMPDLRGAPCPFVIGLIEGYGRVIGGSSGFRAAKARVIALSRPQFEGTWPQSPGAVWTYSSTGRPDLGEIHMDMRPFDEQSSALASRYEVPVVPRHTLWAMRDQHWRPEKDGRRPGYLECPACVSSPDLNCGEWWLDSAQAPLGLPPRC